MKFLLEQILITVVAVAGGCIDIVRCHTADHDHHGHVHYHHHRHLGNNNDRRNEDKGGRGLLACGTKSPSKNEKKLAQVAMQAAMDVIGEVSVVYKIIIPVQFHIIQDDNLSGDVPDAVLTKQISVLNEAFERTKFAFELAGVNRIVETKWYQCSANKKILKKLQKRFAREPRTTLNVYVCKTDQIFSYFPWSTETAKNPEKDGALMPTGTLPGGSFPPYNEGDTLVHLTGHWLGLYHVYEGGCSGNGDFVHDTPATASRASNCSIYTDSCPTIPGPDPVKNYMDFSGDACMDHFTWGQMDRMLAAWYAYRSPPEYHPPPPSTETEDKEQEMNDPSSGGRLGP